MLKFPPTVTLWQLLFNPKMRLGKAWELLLSCGGHIIFLYRTTQIQFIRFSERRNLLCLFFLISCSYHVISKWQPIERKVRKFNPIEIPAKLQHLLPFKSKPKDTPKHRKTPVENRVPVLMQPSEKKTHAAIQQLRLLKHEKVLFMLQQLVLMSIADIMCAHYLPDFSRQGRRNCRMRRRRKHMRRRKQSLNF